MRYNLKLQEDLSLKLLWDWPWGMASFLAFQSEESVLHVGIAWFIGSWSWTPVRSANVSSDGKLTVVKRWLLFYAKTQFERYQIEYMLDAARWRIFRFVRIPWVMLCPKRTEDLELAGYYHVHETVEYQAKITGDDLEAVAACTECGEQLRLGRGTELAYASSHHPTEETAGEHR